MTKKELEEKLKNIPKDKYVYQRIGGRINKYIDIGNYYINCETGNTYEKYDNIFLGKMVENPIDLVEVGDYVNRELITQANYDLYINGDFKEEYAKNIKTILTKELFEANCYKV